MQEIHLDSKEFIFNGTKVDVVIDNKNIIWFNSKKIMKVLGYKSSKDALRDHIPKEDKKRLKLLKFKKGIHPDSVYINESGLYSLLIASRQPVAKEFRRWLTNEVIPSLRKHGYYEIKKCYNKKIMSEINKLEKENENLKRNQKKELYPDGRSDIYFGVM